MLALLGREALPHVTSPAPLAQVRLEVPIPRPRRNIFCIGKNYHEHAHEFAGSGFNSSAAAGAVPAHPIVFSKLPESVVAHRSPVPRDARSPPRSTTKPSSRIIGTGGRAIPREAALEHVWGIRSLTT